MLERNGHQRLPQILATRLVSGVAELRDLRAQVLRTLEAERIPEERRGDIALAVHEVATNAIVHGGGWSRIQLSADKRAWYCDVIDGGPGMDDPQPGRQKPGLREGGFGLWIARHACDEFCIVSSMSGLHVRLVVYAHSHARS